MSMRTCKDAVTGRGVDRRLGVDGDGHLAPHSAMRATVRRRPIRSRAGGRRRGRREAEQLLLGVAPVSRGASAPFPLAGERRHLCAFTCGRSRSPAKRSRHRVEIAGERGGVDGERRGRKVGDAHQVLVVRRQHPDPQGTRQRTVVGSGGEILLAGCHGQTLMIHVRQKSVSNGPSRCSCPGRRRPGCRRRHTEAPVGRLMAVGRWRGGSSTLNCWRNRLAHRRRGVYTSARSCGVDVPKSFLAGHRFGACENAVSRPRPVTWSRS